MTNDGRRDFVQWDAHLRQATERRDLGGAAWTVSVAGQAHSGAAGWLDPAHRQRAMPVDGVFRIASVSKPIVAVAALQLVDDGLIILDEPLDDALPELADRRVLIDPTGPLDGPTVPAQRPLTLRDLLTFRCGLGMDFDFEHPQPVLDRMWELGVGPEPTAPSCEPDQYMAVLSTLPLSDQPGTRWRYHTGSDIASVLIERLRGDTLDTVLQRNVFDPLNMADTTFCLRPDQLARFGSCRMTDDSGELATWDEPNGRWSTPPVFRSGATGLLSTTADLIQFGEMLLSGGQSPNGQILSPTLVTEMTRDQLTDQQRELAQVDVQSTAMGWGLGLAVRHEPTPSGWPGRGAYGWDGGLGSRWLVDPDTNLCAALLTTDAFSSPTPPAIMAEFVEFLSATMRH